jgi:hypothetical protein
MPDDRIPATNGGVAHKPRTLDVEAGVRALLVSCTRTELVAVIANVIYDLEGVNPLLIRNRLADILTGVDMPEHKMEWKRRSIPGVDDDS